MWFIREEQCIIGFDLFIGFVVGKKKIQKLDQYSSSIKQTQPILRKDNHVLVIKAELKTVLFILPLHSIGGCFWLLGKRCF